MACHTPGPRLSDGFGGGRSQVRKQEQRLRGGVPGDSDEASGHPGTRGGPLGAWTRPVAVLRLAEGPQGLR